MNQTIVMIVPFLALRVLLVTKNVVFSTLHQSFSNINFFQADKTTIANLKMLNKEMQYMDQSWRDMQITNRGICIDNLDTALCRVCFAQPFSQDETFGSDVSKELKNKKKSLLRLN
jgi:hypothetical protein